MISKTQYGKSILNDQQKLSDFQQKIKQKALSYSYVDPNIAKAVLKHYQNLYSNKKTTIKEKWTALRSTIGSLAAVIAQLFRAIFHPLSAHHWYSLSKKSEMAIGQCIRLFNQPRGLYWIDLAQFDLDCYEYHQNLRASKPVQPRINTTPSSIEQIIEDPYAENTLKKIFEKAEITLTEVKKLLETPSEENVNLAIEKLKELGTIYSLDKHKLNKQQNELRGKLFSEEKALQIDMQRLWHIFQTDTRTLSKKTHFNNLSSPEIKKAFIAMHTSMIAGWYLTSLERPKSETKDQGSYARDKLTACLKMLKESGNKEDNKTLLERIQNRIIYLSTSNEEQKNNAKNLIQNEPEDEIKLHFCNLFSIAYISDVQKKN